jgi:hypothetical protein
MAESSKLQVCPLCGRVRALDEHQTWLPWKDSRSFDKDEVACAPRILCSTPYCKERSQAMTKQYSPSLTHERRRLA